LFAWGNVLILPAFRPLSRARVVPSCASPVGFQSSSTIKKKCTVQVRRVSLSLAWRSDVCRLIVKNHFFPFCSSLAVCHAAVPSSFEGAVCFLDGRTSDSIHFYIWRRTCVSHCGDAHPRVSTSRVFFFFFSPPPFCCLFLFQRSCVLDSPHMLEVFWFSPKPSVLSTANPTSFAGPHLAPPRCVTLPLLKAVFSQVCLAASPPNSSSSQPSLHLLIIGF